MKLYTREQLIHAVKMARRGPNIFTNEFLYHKEDILEYFTPIELPSDEEINEKAIGLFNYHSERAFFGDGARWMRNKIINK